MPIGDLTAASIERDLRAACLEMEQRLRGGEECSAEQLLALYPKLGEDPDSALELIFAEFVLRRQRGEQISPDQWYERFPQWRERLERLLNVYQIMGAEASQATGVVGDTVRLRDPVLSRLAPVSDVRRVGSYEVLEEIARGGMGVVYKARHSGLKRIVALKLILAGEHAGAEQRARFRQEAEAAARLQHPNIVQIFEIGQEGNRPFLAMEYVDGPPLDQVLIHRRVEGSVGLPANQAAELVECLARAMHHAHQHGVVHRDLKPANVLMEGRGSRVEGREPDSVEAPGSSGPRPLTLDSRPKITDFGLAKTLDESHQETRTGALLGTPSYMAPEQAAGRPADVGPATDVFALGIILYELLTGYLPFQGTSVEETLERVRTVEPIPPSQLQRSVPRDLQTICLKCLQKEIPKRYGSAEALAEDIQRFLRDEPILARPVGHIERAWRWCRRNKVVAALAGGIALLLVCGITVAISLAIWAMNEKGRAVASAHQAQESAGQEREARALADKGFAQAEKAVEHYLDGIEKNERLKEADFLDLRKQLLTSAVPFYEDFVQSKPGDVDLEIRRAKAYMRLAFVHREVGEVDKALADLRKRHDIFQKLSDDFPELPDYRHELAASHLNLGTALRQLGDRNGAKFEYGQALTLQNKLVNEFPDSHEYRRELAVSHNNLGNLFRDLGKLPEAESEHRQGLFLRNQLVSQRPKVATYREELAQSHLNLGIVLRARGDSAGAEAEYGLAAALHTQLAAEFPNVSRYRSDLVQSHNSMGNVLRDRGKLPEAEAESREALRIQTQLAIEFPSIPRYQTVQALIHTNLADVLKERKKLDAAVVEYRQALTVHQSLATGFPSLPDYRHRLAVTRFKLGVLLSEMEKREEARVEYREALQLRTQLIEQSPDVIEYHSELGRVLNNLAVILKNDGEFDEARRLYELAVEHQLRAHRAVPKNSNYANDLRIHYLGLATTMSKQRDHRGIAELGNGFAQINPEVAENAYVAGQFLAQCARLAEKDDKLAEDERQQTVQSYADRAMQYLLEAVRRGFKDATRLKNDQNFDSLRDRAEFQKFVKELEAG